MHDMQFSKYSCDIREILSKVDQEGLEILYGMQSLMHRATITARQTGLHKNYLQM